MRGFIEFIKEQGVVGLAVGFILGGAIAKLVTALVSDIINPTLGFFLGFAKGLDKVVFQVGSTKIAWGHFATSVIDFIIIAFIVYFTVKALGLADHIKKKAS